MTYQVAWHPKTFLIWQLRPPLLCPYSCKNLIPYFLLRRQGSTQVLVWCPGHGGFQCLWNGHSPRKTGKGLEGKKAETHFSVLKVQAQDLAHSVLRSSEMGCSTWEKGCMFVWRALKYMGEKPHCITSIVERYSQHAGNEITPHWKSIKTLKLWIHKDKLILTVFAFPKLAFLAGTWKEMLTRRRVNTNNYCVLPMCYPSGTWHFKSLKFNYIFAFGTLDSHSPMKKSVWEGFKLI